MDACTSIYCIVLISECQVLPRSASRTLLMHWSIHTTCFRRLSFRLGSLCCPNGCGWASQVWNARSSKTINPIVGEVINNCSLSYSPDKNTQQYNIIDWLDNLSHHISFTCSIVDNMRIDIYIFFIVNRNSFFLIFYIWYDR